MNNKKAFEQWWESHPEIHDWHDDPMAVAWKVWQHLQSDSAVAHVFPDDLQKLKTSECAVNVYSVEMGDPDRGETLPLYSHSDAKAPRMTHEIVQAATNAVRENLGKTYMTVASNVLKAIWPLLSASQPAPSAPESLEQAVSDWLNEYGGSDWSDSDNVDALIREAILPNIGAHLSQNAGRCALTDPPKLGAPVIGYSPYWVDPDFNQKGVRHCFRYGDGTTWMSAEWLDEQDCYETIGSEAPTIWWHFPETHDVE